MCIKLHPGILMANGLSFSMDFSVCSLFRAWINADFYFENEKNNKLLHHPHESIIAQLLPLVKSERNQILRTKPLLNSVVIFHSNSSILRFTNKKRRTLCRLLDIWYCANSSLIYSFKVVQKSAQNSSANFAPIWFVSLGFSFAFSLKFILSLQQTNANNNKKN